MTGYRKTPEPYSLYTSDASRIIQRYLAGAVGVPDWSRVLLSWQREDGSWTISDEQAESVHAAGSAIMWVGLAGVSRISSSAGSQEVGGGSAGPRPENNDAPYALVAAHLPEVQEVPGGQVVTRNVIMFGTSTQWPTQAEWTSPSRIQLRIFNPADSGQNLNAGYGVVNDFNQKGQPDVIPPGHEWVSDPNDPRPVFVRADTSPVWTTVESRKVA